MSIFLNKDSKVIVQGITGGEGTKHTALMLKAGTQVVGGVNARKAGQTVAIEGKDLTVFGTVEEAIKETGADVSVVFVPPAGTKSAVVEAVDAAMPLVVRLDGNNVDRGRAILDEMDHPLVTQVDTMDGAADKAAELAATAK